MKHPEAYESMIEEIVRRWPQPTVISPKDRTLSTLNTQLRYAIKAILQAGHHKRLTTIAPAMVISLKIAPGKLWVGPREAAVQPPKLHVETQGTLNRAALELLLAFLNTGCGHPVDVHTDLPVEEVAKRFPNVAVAVLGTDHYRIF